MEQTAPSATDRSLRYLLESELGLLINVTEEHGDHLLIWTSREAAERMVPTLVGAGTYQVVEIEAAELQEELRDLRNDGMRFVLIDAQPDRDGHRFPIDEAIMVYEKAAIPTSEDDAANDHFIQRLDRARKSGSPLDPDAEHIPLDCPACLAYITLPETQYRAWRSGKLESVRCPKCGTAFREAEFDRVRCDDCSKLSGEMPRSLADGMSRSEHPWRCMDCGDREVKRLAVARTKKKGMLDEVNWYSVIVGSAALIALIAGLVVKFVLMD